MSKALVILSGGQDSTTCLFLAKQKHDEIYAVTFDYGQRHSIEIEAAKKVAELASENGTYPITHEVIKVPDCLISSSPLTSDSHLEQYDSYEQMDKIIGDRREKTFVPMRNALFLTIAANRAEALGITTIYTGVCQMDNANYDDCRFVFINAAEEYINTALGHDHRSTPPITIKTPLLFRTKEETVYLAKRTPGCWEAMAYTHTSYDGKYPPTDNNHSNVLRAEGFLEAGEPDPLVLRASFEGLMPLPTTDNYSPKKVSESMALLNLQRAS